MATAALVAQEAQAVSNMKAKAGMDLAQHAKAEQSTTGGFRDLFFVNVLGFPEEKLHCLCMLILVASNRVYLGTLNCLCLMGFALIWSISVILLNTMHTCLKSKTKQGGCGGGLSPPPPSSCTLKTTRTKRDSEHTLRRKPLPRKPGNN